MKLHVNEQSICNLYKLHSYNEQYATVDVLRDVLLEWTILVCTSALGLYL